MSLGSRSPFRALESFPRVSGDEPPIGAIVTAIAAFSPRERG